MQHLWVPGLELKALLELTPVPPEINPGYYLLTGRLIFCRI